MSRSLQGTIWSMVMLLPMGVQQERTVIFQDPADGTERSR